MFRNLYNIRAHEPSCYQKPCSMRAAEPSYYFSRLARKEESRDSVGCESEKKIKSKAVRSTVRCGSCLAKAIYNLQEGVNETYCGQR